MSCLLRVPLLLCLLTLSSAAALRAAEAPPAAPATADTPATEPEEDETSDAEPAKPDPAAEKFWQALKKLQGKSAEELATGRALLQESSDLEFAHAQVLLANCYLSGSYGFSKQPRKALNLLRLAAERDNAFAMISLGTCYATGTGARRDDAKAERWLSSALAADADFSRPVPPADFFAQSGATDAAVAGELLSDPVGSSQATAHFLLGQIRARQNKPAEAQAHYVAAATAGPDGRSGVYQAAVDAALNYAFGKGIPSDTVKAREMLEQSRRLSARMGVNLIQNYVQLKLVDDFAVADLEESVNEAGEARQSALQLHIAQTLADKKSKDYNAAEAAQWYQLAADNGQAWGMLSLAFLYVHGELGTPDPAQAFHWFEKAGEGDTPKHYLGAANLAICLQQGIGTPKDEKRAADLFRKHRDSDIVCYLGTIGRAPVQIVTYEEALALNQTWAKEKNDAHAQFLLARRYYEGAGVTASVPEGLKWLKRAAKANHGGALCRLGWLYEVQPGLHGFSDPAKAAKAATEAYRAAGAAGNIDGLANYAASLNRGFGVPRNEALAIATYERCLRLAPDHARAHSNLGGIYNQKLLNARAAGTSVGTDTWRDAMLAHYEASMRHDPTFAAVALGDLYYEGAFVKQDWGKAYSYYEQAADTPLNKAAAHYRLGFMHEHGQGVPVTYAEAAYHYRIAALEGNVPALRRLINFYLTGTGVSLDFDRAAYWLGLMVRLNQTDALPMIADVLIKKQEYDKAVKMLKVLANVQDPRISGHAHERLSLCYQLGQGVKQNAKRAERHFKLAVEKGNGNALTSLAHRQFAAGNVNDALLNLNQAAQTSSKAAFNLGQLYWFGSYVTADKSKAMDFLRKAAGMHSPEAQYFLAGLCWNQEPSAPKLEEAIDLATKAENLGHPKAAELRQMLEQRLLQQNRRPEENSRIRSS